MSPDRTFEIPIHVVSREVGEESVILNLESGTYFGLDPVGARIWQLIEDGKSLDQICTVMVDEYEVTRDVLERDVLKLAQDLADQQLVVVR